MVALAQVDSHIFATLLFRSWGMLAGGVTILLIPLCLSSEQQGYYFTFASILALQVFFELGMGQVIVQLVAHEAAHLKSEPGGTYFGPSANMARLAALRHLLSRWYLAATLLFIVCVSIMGWYFFRNGELPTIRWAPPWFLLVAATAGNLYLSWQIAVVEGFALVRDVSRLRLFQSMCGFTLMWGVMIAGGGLWVVAIVPAVAMIYSIWWLGRRPATGILTGEAKNLNVLSWKKEIFPFQWRIAVSWISGFFIFQLFSPLVFKYHGAVEAGRVGLAITIFNSIATVGTSWVAAKVPSIGQLLAQGRRVESSSLFRRLTIATLIFSVLSSVILITLISILRHYDISISRRLPETTVLVFLALATTANSFVLPAAMFMRAHKEEPLLFMGVTMAFLTSVAVYLAAPAGASWIIGSYAVLNVVICVPWTMRLLNGRYYKKAEKTHINIIPR